MFKDDAVLVQNELPNFGTGRRLANPESYWQIVSIPPRIDLGSEESSRANQTNNINVRFDPPENPFMPKLTWSAEVGFHRPLAESLPEDSDLRQSHLSAAISSVARGLEVRTERVEDLLAEAAHDIRAPLKSASQILSAVVERIDSSGQLGEPELRLLENATFRLQQADGWAESILLARSLESGTPKAIRNRFYPLQLLDLIRPLMSSVAESHRVKLEWTGWDRSLPRLYVDPNHLSRILLNLVTNAIEASQPGDTVTIRADWKRDVAPKFSIRIEDQGPGLDRHQREIINNQSSGSRPASLPGIGLRVAKALVLAQGGTISVRPQPRLGTRVVVELPVDDNATMIRNWLLSNAASQQDRWTPRSQAEGRDLRVTMHALRVRGLSSRFVDTYLQRATGPNDLVVRVAEHRWLWITLTDNNARSSAMAQSLDYIRQRTLVEQGVCQSALVFASQIFSSSELLAPFSPGSRIAILTAKLASKLGELTANRAVYLDDLEQRKESVRGTSIELPRKSKLGTGGRLRMDSPAKAQPLKQSHLPKFTNPEPKTLGLGAPDAKLTRALIEIASHWHATHARMEGRPENSVPRPKQEFGGNFVTSPVASRSES